MDEGRMKAQLTEGEPLLCSEALTSCLPTDPHNKLESGQNVAPLSTLFFRFRIQTEVPAYLSVLRFSILDN